MVESTLDLSICILTRSQPLLLPQCVASCLAEVERANVTAEIIVIDNASEDRYPERLLTISPLIRVLRNEQNVGFSAGNNRAIRSSSGRYVLVLNDDAILEDRSLGLLLQKLHSDPGVGAVGPKLLNPDGSLQRNFTNRRPPSLRGILCQLLLVEGILEKHGWTRDLFTMSRDLERSCDTDHIAGACLLARRRALEEVGLFDEGFYYLYEDGDLCLRLKKAGWAINYLAEARVVHVGSASLRKMDWSESRTAAFRSMVYYFKKNGSPLRCFSIRLMVSLIVLLRLPVTAVRRMMLTRSARLGLRDTMRGSLRTLRVLLLE